MEELVAKGGKPAKPTAKPEEKPGGPVFTQENVTQEALIAALTLPPAASAAKPPAAKPSAPKPKGLEHLDIEGLAAAAQDGMKAVMVGAGEEVAKAASKQIVGTKAAPSTEREV